MFGSVMRVCPGRGLAEMEMRVCLSFLLGRLEIKLEAGHPPFRFKVCPAIDIKVVLRERKGYKICTLPFC